jgi:membrane fusion protein (multidrug efflux system)
MGLKLGALVVVSLGCSKPAPPRPPPPAVRVATLQIQPIPQEREWLATLEGAVTADIRPQVTGTIQSVDYQEGTVVKPGTLLFTIDDRPFVAASEKARGDYENARAELDKNRADVSRYEPLAAEHAIPREQLENAQAAVRASEASVVAMRGNLQSAQLNVEWTRVRSPIDGLAGIARVRIGNLVTSNESLTVVSTLDPIRASFSISQQEYLQVAEIIQHVNAPEYARARWFELILLDGRVHPFGAQQVIVNREIDPTTGTLLIQALFPNPGNILRPGMFAKIHMRAQRESPTVVVPEAAVQRLQGQTRVAVVGAGDQVELRSVRLGRLLEHAYVVEEGVTAGERVIVEGQQNVQPGMTVTPEPWTPPATQPTQPATPPATQPSAVR